MPHSVVIAPDSFKGTLAAREAAEAIAAGWRSERPGDDILMLPQADGGEGTLDAIEASVPDTVRHVVPSVTGPDGSPVAASWLALPDGTAVVELAISSGLPLMHEPDPLGATTRGLGEVVLAALATRPRRLLVGLGGSASTDGGRGVLEVVPSVEVEVVLLTDVTAPLLGPRGAAAVFGPQKGASPAQIVQLEQRLAAFAAELGGDPTAPGAGAAGGTGFGLATAWGATISSGADHIAGLTGLAAALDRMDAALTGEGRYDAQSTTGKVVGQLLARAEHLDVTVGVLAGQLGAVAPVWAVALADLAGSTTAALADPARWLEAAGRRAARELPPTFSRRRASL